MSIAARRPVDLLYRFHSTNRQRVLLPQPAGKTAQLYRRNVVQINLIRIYFHPYDPGPGQSSSAALASLPASADAMGMNLYIDTHTHLDFTAFAADREQVLASSSALGVRRILLMGVTRDNWQSIWRLVESDSRYYAAFGLHPVFLDQHRPDDIEQLRRQLEQHADDPRCCAIGEFGLDYFIDAPDHDRQQLLFESQLQLASEMQLPALLHVRRAHAAVIAALKRYQLKRGGIIHAFSGSIEEAREYIRLGFKLGLGGAATWPQAKRMHRVIPQLPADSMVLETDSPDMAPAFRPHQRNSPENLPQICAELAALRGETADQLARQCLHNTCELFNWPVATVS